MEALISSADAVVVAAFLVAIPAIISAINAWQTRKQLKPNGGSSLRDAVDRIEQAGQRTEQKVIDNHADLLDVRADMRETHGRLRNVESALRVASADRKDIAADLAATHTDL